MESSPEVAFKSMRRTAMGLDSLLVSQKSDQKKTLFRQVLAARVPGL
jgi:hypothetical protein